MSDTPVGSVTGQDTLEITEDSATRTQSGGPSGAQDPDSRVRVARTAELVPRPELVAWLEAVAQEARATAYRCGDPVVGMMHGQRQAALVDVAEALKAGNPWEESTETSVPTAPRTAADQAIAREVLAELDRARGLHGLQHDLPVWGGSGQTMAWEEEGEYIEGAARAWLDRDPSWFAILVEEVGELLQERDDAKLRAEAVQCAAMCIALIAKLDADAEVPRG